MQISVKSESEPYLVLRPQGYFEYQLPISAKGILCIGNKVLLVGNARGELELPGGKLEKGESPEECAKREVAEEVGLDVSGAELIHAWVYEILSNRHVFVIAYGVVSAAKSVDEIELIIDQEVGSARWVAIEELETCAMPRQYIIAIHMWYERLQSNNNRVKQ